MIAAAGLALALVAPAAAAPAIDWDPIFFYGPGITATFSPVGDTLVGVGTVSHFGPPLEFLNPLISPPGPNEYTIYVRALTSLGTTTSGPPAFTFYSTNYSGGTIAIFEDTTPDGSFDPNPPNAGVPGDFADGTLILYGTFSNFYTQVDNFSTKNTGNAEGTIAWTGGSLLPLTGDANVKSCPGLFTGGITFYPPVMIPGYVYRDDGKIDFNCPTPAVNSTWGKIKSSYR